jgi:hypothetical protein
MCREMYDSMPAKIGTQHRLAARLKIESFQRTGSPRESRNFSASLRLKRSLTKSTPTSAADRIASVDQRPRP